MGSNLASCYEKLQPAEHIGSSNVASSHHLKQRLLAKKKARE
jgi:hypothetical protein